MKCDLKYYQCITCKNWVYHRKYMSMIRYCSLSLPKKLSIQLTFPVIKDESCQDVQSCEDILSPSRSCKKGQNGIY